MEVTVNRSIKYDFLYLRTKIGVRHWEDATVNNVEDTEGKLIPLREGDYWCPTINIDTGKIINWEIGTIASIHYKCCDDGEYWLIAVDGFELKYPSYYVPNILDLYEDSYGDYVIMNIDKNGYIKDWNSHANITDFLKKE